MSGTRRTSRYGRAGVAVAAASIVLLAACASDDSSSSSTAAATSAPTQASTTAAAAPTTAASGTTAAPGATAAPTTAAPSTTAAQADGPATGSPVKVGWISQSGGTGATANTVHDDVAKAMVKYLNDKKHGLGGHTIDLDICGTGGDAAKYTDCGNKMVSDGVVAVIMPESTAPENSWKVLKDNKIPVYFYSGGNPDMMADASSTFMFGDPTEVLLDVPIAVAKKNNLKEASIIVVDVPAATQSYTTNGPALFERNGIKLNLIKFPLSTADFTPIVAQMSNLDTVAMVIGTDAMCIGAVQALRASSFSHPIIEIGCDTQNARDALGKDMKGLIIPGVNLTPDADPTNPGVVLWDQIMTTYGSGPVKEQRTLGFTAFRMWITFSMAMQGIQGDPTPASVIAAFRSMPQIEVPGGLGRKMKCDGSVDPQRPAICGAGVVIASLDEKGLPVKPYEVVSAA